ncbi:Proteasome subunit beta [archaeon HR06]|nr:Proteasome subunit beta [archaeon HR06]
MTYYYMPGATVVGITFKDGVILVAEKRVSYGNYIVSKSGKKIFKITDNVGIACAGMVGDMQMLSREISLYVKLKEIEIRRKMSPSSIAKLTSVLMFERRLFPLLTQVILGGVNGKPGIFVLDPLGSVIADEYAAVGSGAEMAIGLIETYYKPNMSEDEAKELAIKAIKAAIQRDAASGDGVDILIITKNGIREESITF